MGRKLSDTISVLVIVAALCFCSAAAAEDKVGKKNVADKAETLLTDLADDD